MSLQVWLPLNGDLHNQGLKQYNLSMFRGSEIYNNNGKIGKCFYANGVNTIKILNIIPDFYNYSAYSLCAWIYIEAQNTSHTGCGIISAGNWNSQVLNLGLSDWSTNHYTRLRISGTNWSRTYAYNFSLNTWYHIVVSSDSNKTYAYVNGVLIGDSQTSFLPTSIEGDDICIGGATYYSGMQFFGRINDVRIYDHCLSDKEVEEIAKGLVLHYKLNNNNIGNENLLLNSLIPTSGNGATGVVKSIENGIQKVVADNPNSNWVTFTNHNTTLALAKGDSFTFSLMIKSPDSNKKPTVYFQSGMGYFSMQGTMSSDWSIIYYTGIWNIDNLVTNIHLGFSSAPGTYYIRYFKLEKGTTYTSWAPNHNDQEWSEYGCDNNIIYDSSGYNNNGEIIGTITLSSDTARYFTSTNMNNTNTANHIECINELTLPIEGITTTLWVKSTKSTNQVIFTTPQIQFGTLNSLGYCFPNTNQNGWTLNNFINNNWNFIAITRIGATIKLYVNGVLETQSGAANNYNHNKNVLWLLNRGNNNSYAGNASISDFRLYATALTENQILELYHTSATIDNQGNVYAREVIE